MKSGSILTIFAYKSEQKMNDVQVWDPLRKKNVPLTPEERVRQWFITILRDTMSVPMHMMMSEVGMKFGCGPVKKEYRADIVVYDRTPAPVLVVECKRPDVELTKEVLEQALRYDMVMNVRYLALTNGRKTYFCRKEDDGRVTFLTAAPMYTQMIGVNAELTTEDNKRQ